MAENANPDVMTYRINNLFFNKVPYCVTVCRIVKFLFLWCIVSLKKNKSSVKINKPYKNINIKLERKPNCCCRTPPKNGASAGVNETHIPTLEDLIASSVP